MITKKLIINQVRIHFLLFGVLLFTPKIFSQGNICGLDDPGGTQSSEITGFQGLKFFDQSNACNELILKCNFVFLTRDNGTGTFQNNSSEILDMVSGMNNLWSSIVDPSNCSPNQGYPIDSKLRLDVSYDYISNTDAFLLQ